VGSWSVATNQGYQRDVHYTARGTGQDMAAWTFNVTPGNYRVSVTWSPHSNRATNAPYMVLDGSSALATVRINQEQSPNDRTDAGVSWEDLGVFTITSNTLAVKLSDDANEYVIADGVRIEPVSEVPPPQPAPQIIDNSSAGFQAVGSWSVATNQGFQQDVHYTARGSGQDMATWTFAVTPGQYRVSATWSPHPNRATDAPYTIGNGTTNLATVRVNQEQSPNDFSDQGVAWEDLGGPYDITSGTLVVKLSDAANEFVIADAIRVERLGDATNGNGDLLEPNDSFDQATVLGLGDQRRDNLTIHPLGDEDFFRWKTTATGTLKVDILFSHAGGDLDLELFDVNRNRVAFSDSINDDESITRQVFADETFFVRVFGFNGATNTYDLVIDGP
jgi:hypothetical protein